MQYFNIDRTYYEELDPHPKRGRVLERKLRSLLVAALTIGTVSVMVLVLANMFMSFASDSNDSGKDKIVLSASAPEDGNVTVKSDKGSVRGKRMISRAGREYLAFLGIPYAKPPLGELRFLPPVENDAWNNTLDAIAFKPDCLQKDKYNPELVIKGSEDCLYLNVYSPKNFTNTGRQRGRFPVMVYIHGGGQFGSANRYGADYFMDEDVVLITFHYRLGVLGNLNTNDSNARGNQGLKDQVMALQWVKDNIKEFGGDRRKVTIFGNSYGGMEVTTHLVSSMSAGLFQQAISQSGTEIMPTIFTLNPLKSANELGQSLNCTGNTTADLVTCFRNIDAEKIILSSFLMDFKTSVEPSADTDDVFLSDTPLHILQDGQINRVTAMFGATSGEFLYDSLSILSSPNLTESFNKNWAENAVSHLSLNYTPGVQNPEQIANAAKEFYLGNKNLSREIETNFTAMISDRRITHPATVFATFQLEKARRQDNVYLYYFDYDAPKSYADEALKNYYGNSTEEYLGAAHADELQFLFPYDPYPAVPMGSKHANFSQMLVRLWVSFAATGTPTGADNGAEWLPIEQQKPYKWFEISNEPKMIDFLGDRMNFWDSFNLTDLYF